MLRNPLNLLSKQSMSDSAFMKPFNSHLENPISDGIPVFQSPLGMLDDTTYPFKTKLTNQFLNHPRSQSFEQTNSEDMLSRVINTRHINKNKPNQKPLPIDPIFPGIMFKETPINKHQNSHYSDNAPLSRKVPNIADSRPSPNIQKFPTTFEDKKEFSFENIHHISQHNPQNERTINNKQVINTNKNSPNLREIIQSSLSNLQNTEEKIHVPNTNNRHRIHNSDHYPFNIQQSSPQLPLQKPLNRNTHDSSLNTEPLKAQLSSLLHNLKNKKDFADKILTSSRSFHPGDSKVNAVDKNTRLSEPFLNKQDNSKKNETIKNILDKIKNWKNNSSRNIENRQFGFHSNKFYSEPMPSKDFKINVPSSPLVKDQATVDLMDIQLWAYLQHLNNLPDLSKIDGLLDGIDNLQATLSENLEDDKGAKVLIKTPVSERKRNRNRRRRKKKKNENRNDNNSALSIDHIDAGKALLDTRKEQVKPMKENIGSIPLNKQTETVSSTTTEHSHPSLKIFENIEEHLQNSNFVKRIIQQPESSSIKTNSLLLTTTKKPINFANNHKNKETVSLLNSNKIKILNSPKNIHQKELIKKLIPQLSMLVNLTKSKDPNMPKTVVITPELFNNHNHRKDRYQETNDEINASKSIRLPSKNFNLNNFEEKHTEMIKNNEEISNKFSGVLFNEEEASNNKNILSSSGFKVDQNTILLPTNNVLSEANNNQNNVMHTLPLSNAVNQDQTITKNINIQNTHVEEQKMLPNVDTSNSNVNQKPINGPNLMALLSNLKAISDNSKTNKNSNNQLNSNPNNSQNNHYYSQQNKKLNITNKDDFNPLDIENKKQDTHYDSSLPLAHQLNAALPPNANKILEALNNKIKLQLGLENSQSPSIIPNISNGGLASLGVSNNVDKRNFGLNNPVTSFDLENNQQNIKPSTQIIRARSASHEPRFTSSQTYHTPPQNRKRNRKRGRGRNKKRRRPRSVKV